MAIFIFYVSLSLCASEMSLPAFPTSQSLKNHGVKWSLYSRRVLNTPTKTRGLDFTLKTLIMYTYGCVIEVDT